MRVFCALNAVESSCHINKCDVAQFSLAMFQRAQYVAGFKEMFFLIFSMFSMMVNVWI